MTKINEIKQTATFLPSQFHDWMLGIFEAIEACETRELEYGFADSSIKTIAELLASHMLNFQEEKSRDRRTIMCTQAIVLASTLGTIIGKYGHTDMVQKSINDLREKMLGAGFKFVDKSKFTQFKKVAETRNATERLVNIDKKINLQDKDATEALKSATDIIAKIVDSIKNDISALDADSKGLKQ